MLLFELNSCAETKGIEGWLDILKCKTAQNNVRTLTTVLILTQNDALSSTIIRRGECSKSFLSCCVPYSQFNPFSRQLDSLYFKVNTYRHTSLDLMTQNTIGLTNG